MNPNSTPPPTNEQPQPVRFLVGRDSTINTKNNSCPYARTLTGFSLSLNARVVVALTCKRWGCRVCGEKKMAHYGWKVAKAAPNKLITLTTNPNVWENPRAAYDGTRRKVTEFATKVRRFAKPFEYFKVLEVTKNGWPHYHLIARSPYLPQRKLSAIWNHLTNAPIVDVRAIKKSGEVYQYVVKYLGKQKYIPWTERRCSWSRGFFEKDDFKPPASLEIELVETYEEHPADFMFYYHKGQKVEELSDSCWFFVDMDKVDPESN
jgi:hypothetical protein